MKPVIFSTHEVQATLDNRQTMFRRVIKPNIAAGLEIDTDGSVIGFYDQCEGCVFPVTNYAPYRPGDILCVRETWRETGVIAQPYAYRANEQGLTLIGESGNILKVRYRYKPSIHMPREAARIFLRVKDVRVERLQDISEADARREGIFVFDTGVDVDDETPLTIPARERFKVLWDDLSAKKGHGWDTNPWCWVYAFERVNREDLT